MHQAVSVDFVAAPIDAAPGLLNVITHPPQHEPVLSMRRDRPVIEIGEIVVHGDTIHIAPMRGTGECHRRYLMGAAEAAFFGTCHEALGWKKVSEGGETWWSTWISAPTDIAVTPHPVEGPVWMGLPSRRIESALPRVPRG